MSVRVYVQSLKRDSASDEVVTDTAGDRILKPTFHGSAG